MAKGNGQRLKALYILKILQENSDEKHLLKTQQIIDRLEGYGIPAERKSVYADISALKELGYDIVCVRARANGGYYLKNRSFELPELKLLTDAVQASRLITVKKSRQLISKLETLASPFEAKQLNRQVYVSDRNKTDNETIYETIKSCKIRGSIFIKDADNKFTIKTTPTDNSVCLFSLENCNIVDPQHKSYVTLDDNMFVTNMIEKRVVSSYFNCGGYSFKDVNDFIEGYEFCKKFENKEHMYLSHIIYYLILFKKMIFKPVMAESYTDFAIEKLL